MTKKKDVTELTDRELAKRLFPAEVVEKAKEEAKKSDERADKAEKNRRK